MVLTRVTKCGLLVDSSRKELEDPSKFKAFYQFVFQYSKEPSQRSLPAETAMALWDILLRGRFALLDAWLEFLKDNVGSLLLAEVILKRCVCVDS